MKKPKPTKSSAAKARGVTAVVVIEILDEVLAALFELRMALESEVRRE